MKKSERIGAIIKILSDNPNKVLSLNYFGEKLNAAKSSISEDIKEAKKIIISLGLGEIQTIAGAGGGVKYFPLISKEDAVSALEKLCEKLNDPTRLLGGGFLYTSDIMFDPTYVDKLAAIFARTFKDKEVDCVVTIETKGIPLAVMTAKYLNVPSIVIRRESRISEGPTVSINYFSGSSERIQKMSISKRATENMKNALIIDDFMRAGGSLKGIAEMLSEFNINVAGIGVAIATYLPEKKKVDEYTALIYFDDKSTEHGEINMSINSDFF